LLLLVPLTAEPLPDIPLLAFRLVASLLCVHLLYVSTRDGPPLLSRLPLGGLAEGGFVVAAFLAGLVAATGGRDVDPRSLAGAASRDPMALALCLCLGLAALDLLVFARDALRYGSGAILALLAADLAFRALVGRPSTVYELALALALLGLAAASARLCRTTVAWRGDLALAEAGGDPP
jgi:hypothetical protein